MALNLPILEKLSWSVTSRGDLPPTVRLLWRGEIEDRHSWLTAGSNWIIPLMSVVTWCDCTQPFTPTATANVWQSNIIKNWYEVNSHALLLHLYVFAFVDHLVVKCVNTDTVQKCCVCIVPVSKDTHTHTSSVTPYSFVCETLSSSHHVTSLTTDKLQTAILSAVLTAGAI